MPIVATRRSWGRRKPPVGTPLARAHPLARGLVGCWPLNEGTGTLARDAAGGNHLTLTAASLWSASPALGPALAADSTNYAVTNAARGVGDCSSPFTLAFWRYRLNVSEHLHVFTVGT